MNLEPQAQGIGLCGAHRTGKTTMASCCAKQYELLLVETTTSSVFAQHGLDPSAPMDFNQRLWIQDKVIAAAEQVWQQADSAFITDRTPLDMLAYTLAEVQGDTVYEAGELQAYTQRCFAAVNRYFSSLVVVQPGIDLVEEAGKAALHRGYIEHLNSLIIGFCADERQQLPAHVMPRALLDLQQRCQWLAEKCSLPAI